MSEPGGPSQKPWWFMGPPHCRPLGVCALLLLCRRADVMERKGDSSLSLFCQTCHMGFLFNAHKHIVLYRQQWRCGVERVERVSCLWCFSFCVKKTAVKFHTLMICHSIVYSDYHSCCLHRYGWFICTVYCPMPLTSSTQAIYHVLAKGVKK